MPFRSWITVFFPTPLIFRYHLPLNILFLWTSVYVDMAKCCPSWLSFKHWPSLESWDSQNALQRQNTEISKQIFPEKEYRGLSPNFHIHASVSDLYIPTIGMPILLVDRSWDYTNRSQTHECWNWGWGRAIHRKGIHKWDFRCSVGTERNSSIIPTYSIFK